jgi:hypothetical protein
MKTFFLGTHLPGWLSWCDVPLMVSDRRLRDVKRPLPARAPWVLDSGGFTELSMHGTWANGPCPQEYAERVARYQRWIGNLAWAAPQDWMCEPFILAKTGLQVHVHQWRTIDNLRDLRNAWNQHPGPSPFIPVLQGYAVDDYLRHIDLYRAAGIDLTAEPVVGVGSVCRRQGTAEIDVLFRELHAAGIRGMHGFGVKKLGLERFAHLLHSADSLAWSFAARREPALSECQGHKNCANCPRYALAWRAELLAQVASGEARPRQGDLLDMLRGVAS